MATLNFSSLTNSFSFDQAINTQQSAAPTASPTAYSWTTTSTFNYTAVSTAGNITAAPSGTITAITVNYTTNPAFTITDLTVGLASLIDLATPANTPEKFWESVLAGPTTIYTQPNSSGITLAGDFYEVEGNQTGAADIFRGLLNSTGSGTLSGDSHIVKAGANLTGGADLFVNAAQQMLCGEAYNAFGGVKGGADTFNYVIPYNQTVSYFLVQLLGEVYNHGGGLGANALVGGADVFTIKNYQSVSEIYGEAYSSTDAKKIVGGGDKITVDLAPAAISPGNVSVVIGDVRNVTGATDGNVATVFDAIGGADTIFVRNMAGSFITGDFDTVTFTGANQGAMGGNDVITLSNNLTGLPPSPPPLVQVSSTYGDFRTLSSLTSTFKGGNDKITLINVITNVVHGDGESNSGTGLNFTGGNDEITSSWTLPNSGSSLPQAYGDMQTFSGHNFTGGADVIVATNPRIGMSTTVYGDVSNYSGSTGGVFTGGDDTITINFSGVATQAFIYGDVFTATSAGNGIFKGGNDKLTGSAGNDQLYGDWANTVTGFTGGVTGGADVLDGRGGNDLLDGGGGVDTAVFSLAIPVYVDLNGIVGSHPSDLYEAIGQGFDQLVAIENVTGSSANDTIIGNAGGNVLRGGGGADKLYGLNGADVLTGGLGADFLSGGRTTLPEASAARDIFRYEAFAESGVTGATADKILFFDKGPAATDDRINLNPLDANLALAGNQNFTFKGGAAFSLAGGEVRVVTSGADTLVQIDNDADAAVEMLIIVKGVTGLTGADFLL